MLFILWLCPKAQGTKGMGLMSHCDLVLSFQPTFLVLPLGLPLVSPNVMNIYISSAHEILLTSFALC